MLTDILGVIKSKVILTPNTKDKNNANKKVNKNFTPFRKTIKRSFTKIDNFFSNLNKTTKYFGEEEPKINTPLSIEDQQGNKINVYFKKKDNNVLAPIDEEGQEINDMRMLKNIYDEMKKQFNSNAVKRAFRKRLSFSMRPDYTNQIFTQFLSEKEDELGQKKDSKDSKNGNYYQLN